MFKMLKERWHIIEEYGNNKYAITESGKVYSIKYNKLKQLSVKGLNNPKRYCSITLSENNIHKDFQIHRLVGKYFVDGYFDGAEIDHKDKNIHNNHYSNLEWVTHKENLHRSYTTMSQIRNFKLWKITNGKDFESKILKGHLQILKCIEDNNLNIKISMLEKHKEHNGYKLIEVKKV